VRHVVERKIEGTEEEEDLKDESVDGRIILKIFNKLDWEKRKLD
jgi:hypothetical protein